MTKNFIYTTSKDSAEALKKAGFVLVNRTPNGWTFINDKKIQFQNLSNVVFTNKLSV